MNRSLMNARRFLGRMLVGVSLAAVAFASGGCESSPKRVEAPSERAYSFWPLPPAEPRMQFVRSFMSLGDLTRTKQSTFDRLVFGKEDPNEASIDKPYGVDMKDGVIYVCDIRLPGLVVLDVKNKQMRLVGVSGLNKLSHPVDVAVADDGRLYVADNWANSIFVFRNERYETTIGHANMKPVSVAVHGDRLYMCDIEAQHVEVFNRHTGESLFTFGQVGDGDGQFRVPLAVDVDRDGNVYVSDMMRCRVQKFTPDGEFISGMGSMGDHVGSFARPKQLAVDRDGIIYVVDAAFQNVQMFNQDYQVLMEFGAAGNFPGAMNLPVGICVSDEGIEYFQDDIHPGFNAKRLVVVTNQFGRQTVNVYALGERRPDVPLEEFIRRAAKVNTGLGVNPEGKQFQDQGMQPEPVIEDEEEGQQAPDEPSDDGGGGKPLASINREATSRTRGRKNGRQGRSARLRFFSSSSYRKPHRGAGAARGRRRGRVRVEWVLD